MKSPRQSALLLLLASAPAWTQTYTIAGIVKNDAGRPVKRVRVAIASVEARQNQTAVQTAADGRFRFDNLAAGKYQLTAEPPTGGAQAYGMRSRSTGFGTAVATGPGIPSDNLVFQLIPPAAIVGRVLDAEGEPILSALVQLFASRILNGRRTVFSWSSAYTDYRGEYRFSGIADGAYYLAVTGTPWYVDRLQRATGPLTQMGYGNTFYPNTREARSAALLRVKPGQELTADFLLVAAPAGKLTVNLAGAPPGTPVKLEVTFDGMAGSKCWERIMEAPLPGPATISGIQPGTYTVRAEAKIGPESMYGLQPVTIGIDATSTTITLSAAPVVTGRLWLEDASSVPDGTLIQLANEIESERARRPVAKDGSFQFDAVPPGQYRVTVSLPGKMLHLRSITLNGVFAKEDMIDIVANAKLELLGPLHGAKVSGVATRNGEPLVGALALLAPRRESSNPLDYRAFQTDSDGSFEFEGLPPGEYVVIILEDWLDFEYANPLAVRPYLETGRAVHLENGQTQKLRVDLK